MSLTGPPPVSTNPVHRLANDLRAELRAPARFPPGDVLPSVRRTHRVIADPLRLLLDAYERYGPVFSLRVLTHARRVHDRPGGQPPHPRLARERLHVARRRRSPT